MAFTCDLVTSQYGQPFTEISGFLHVLIIWNKYYMLKKNKFKVKNEYETQGKPNDDLIILFDYYYYIYKSYQITPMDTSY